MTHYDKSRYYDDTTGKSRKNTWADYEGWQVDLEECSRCDGSGVLDRDTERCSKCDGYGEVRGHDCPRCNGNGYVETGGSTCPRCDGTGSIGNSGPSRKY